MERERKKGRLASKMRFIPPMNVEVFNQIYSFRVDFEHSFIKKTYHKSCAMETLIQNSALPQNVYNAFCLFTGLFCFFFRRKDFTKFYEANNNNFGCAQRIHVYVRHFITMEGAE